MKLTFEVFLDDNSKWRFRAKARNNEIILQSEAYESRQSAVDTVYLIMREAATAHVEVIK